MSIHEYNLLTSASLPNKIFIMGTFPCKFPKCHFRPNINTDTTIIGPNGVPIKISENFNCNSSNVIYAIWVISSQKQSILEKPAIQSDNG